MATKRSKGLSGITAKETKPGWELTTGLFEVHWKRGPEGLYADRVRVEGVEFHYISGKKAYSERGELQRRGGRRA